ncbi:hypothetical protein IKP85_05950 [bacterium]|nr:hypothetical protein [bacterium]
MLANPGTKQFGAITAKKRNRKSNNAEFDLESYKFIGKNDRRMRFNTSKDPIYYIFDCVENRPISTLAKEFVKDSFVDIAHFVSRVVG